MKLKRVVLATAVATFALGALAQQPPGRPIGAAPTPNATSGKGQEKVEGKDADAAKDADGMKDDDGKKDKKRDRRKHHDHKKD